MSALLDAALGSLSEPLTGRHWDGPRVADRCARRLSFYDRCGLKPGDRVFFHYGNTAEFFVDLIAVWNLGGCAVPIDTRLTPFEVETLARAAAPRWSLWLGTPDADVAPRLAALGARVVDALEADAQPHRERPPALRAVSLAADALILFTSGTTGEPKGVVHTHRSLRARWAALRQSLGLASFRRTLCLLPTHFGHGLICNCLFPWLHGQELFIVPPFKADLIAGLGALLDEHEITFLSSVPTVWRLALKTSAPPRADHLERVFCGSAPLSAHLWSDIRRWSRARDVWNAYGITETGSWLAGTSMEDFVPEDGLVGEPWGGAIEVVGAGGIPATGASCAPGESGDVWVHTPALMRGYLGRDDLTAEVVSAGWFRTGDIGSVDSRGWLYLRGREREEINKGGMKIYPADLDAVVERFDDAVDVCAFAIEDSLLGEDVGIAVVLRDDDPARLGALKEWMALHLARHQMPRRWYVVDEIPRTSRGKVNRSAVAARCARLEPVDLGGAGKRR